MWRGKLSLLLVFLLLVQFVRFTQFEPLLAVAAVNNSQWQRGASIQPRTSTGFMSTEFKASLFQLAEAGGNYVTLIIPFWSPNGSSSEIVPALNTPTDEALIAAIEHAHMLRLAVNLKFHPEAGGVAWRARINPTDRPAWFRNYGALLNHYAEIGRSYNVEMMTIGAELINMTLDRVHPNNTQSWRNIIAELRRIYPGRLTYCANWRESATTGELDQIEFFDDLDFVMISAYYPPATSRNYTPQSLLNRWAMWETQSIRPAWQRFNKPIIFGEIGYRSLDGALINPPDWRATGPVDELEQAQGYQALFEFWSTRTYMQGIHIWDWHPNPNAGGPNDTDFTPQNKQAMEVITSWFRDNRAPIPPPPSPNATNIVLYAADVPDSSIRGNWSKVGDSAAAAQTKLYNRNNSASRITSPQTNPTNYFEITFNAEVNTPYHLWLRMRADGNHWSSDSVYVQFSDSLNESNISDYRIGTNKGLTVQLEEGLNAGVSGWGWNDNHWGELGVNVKFARSGTHTIRIQQREDGISIDQIVLSPNTYLTQRPGTVKTDSTIISKFSPESPPPPPPPPPPAARIDNWWPADGSTIGGMSLFKALLTERLLTEYDLYWQVDGDRLNLMYDSQEDRPHKEVYVDVSGWFWNGNGPYRIAFIAKDLAGNTIAEKSITIFIAR